MKKVLRLNPVNKCLRFETIQESGYMWMAIVNATPNIYCNWKIIISWTLTFHFYYNMVEQCLLSKNAL